MNHEDLRQLPVPERLRLMEELWASLVERLEGLDVPAWHRHELDTRLKAHDAAPSDTVDWAKAKAELAGSTVK